MGKTAETIRMDYYEALDQATKLEEIAEQLRKLANVTMQQSMNELMNDWKGENAQRFAQREDMTVEDVRQIAKDIKAVAECMRKLAKKVYDTEMLAISIITGTSV